MLCSSCGKDIPFVGQVCPHCQRDKSNDQVAQVVGCVGLFVGAGLGWVIGGVVGAIIGAVITAGLFMVPFLNKSTPPVVKVETDPTTSKNAVASTSVPTADPEQVLRKLKQLLDSGLITEAEYDAKKASVLNRL